MNTILVGDDLVPYQVLLERSLQSHEALDLKKTNDPRLDDETRAALTMRDCA
jgi:hypothetical protein